MYYDPSGFDSQKDMAATMAGMTYDERIDALYTRRNEYVQTKIDTGTLPVSYAPLQENELASWIISKCTQNNRRWCDSASYAVCSFYRY